VQLLDKKGKQLSEVDVLLLGADGSLVPGEVKLHGTGLVKDDLAKLDHVGELLNSPWTFVATPDWASECPPLWQAAAITGDKGRLVLTGERLLDPSPLPPWGNDPFEWIVADTNTIGERHRSFAEQIRDRTERESAARIPGRLNQRPELD
jgi:hypothetical protein